MATKMPNVRLIALLIFVLFLLLVICLFANAEVKSTDYYFPCSQRKHVQTPSSITILCVCNSTYCDTVAPVPELQVNEAATYTTSKGGQRLELTTGKFQFNASKIESDVEIIVDTSMTYQTVIGFGGAFTDAAGINILSLPKPAQQKLLESYFSHSGGIRYNIGRIPMASCDFSTHVYSYDDVDGDFNLTHFQLDDTDKKLKIPLIQLAQNIIGNQTKLKLFGSPWSAPGWMKTSGKMYGNGTLKGNPGEQYYKAWAQYFVRFIQEYQKYNLSIWGLTAQNEPTTGFLANYSFQTMAFTPERQRDFIKFDLGPALHEVGYGNIKLMIGDDQRVVVPKWAHIVMQDPEAARYVSGVGIHWYLNWLMPAAVQNYLYRQLTDNKTQFLLATEACTGEAIGNVDEPGVLLGDWRRGERYAADILTQLNYWVSGWVDWNLALDLHGGPNWVNNFVDAPIVVNKTSGEFYKQPMFYALAHFSTFMPEGSKRIKVSSTAGAAVEATAVLTTDNHVVLVLLNSQSLAFDVSVKQSQIVKKALRVHLPAHSMQTVLWKAT